MEPVASAGTRHKNQLLIREAFLLIWRSAPCWMLLNAGLVVIEGLLPLFTLYLLKLLVDTVTASLQAPAETQILGHAALLIILMGIVSLTAALCRSLGKLTREAQVQATTDHIYDVIHSKSVNIDLEYYENARYYDSLHRAQQEAPFRPARMVNSLLEFTQNGISLAAMAGLIYAIHWSIALILLVAVIPEITARLRFANRAYRRERNNTPVERLSRYFSWLLTGDMHAKEVRIFNLGHVLKQRFGGLREKLRQDRLRLAVRRSSCELFGQVVTAAAIFGTFALVAQRAIQGAITVGDLVMYYQALQRGQIFLQGGLNSLADLYEDNLFLSSFYEFLELPIRVVEPVAPKPMPSPIESGIILDHVAFRYPNSSPGMVLEDITFAIRPGETVALVGDNGSGKTTLIKLLCRLYDPTKGSIAVDGTDLCDLSLQDLRRNIGVIFQDYAHYQLTALENIWFGNVDAPPDWHRVASVAESSGAHEVIEKLPKGYRTILGKWFEEGEEISVGEWQKVALARALFRDAQIIIFDEPTSAIDARAEHEFFSRLRQLSGDKIIILVSHRLSTVSMADSIYVLEHGRIVESGSHSELMGYCGKYRQAFEIQAEKYRMETHH